MSEATYEEKQELSWPYPVRYGVVNEISTDVLILGGGLAGGFAAVAAVRNGAKVTIIEKAGMMRSGHAGGGLDHWEDVVVPGVSTVTPEQLGQARLNNHLGYGFKEHYKVTAEEGWDRLLDLEKMGIKIRDDEDRYVGAIHRDEKSKLLFAHDPRANATVIFWGGGPAGKPKAGVKWALYNECKRLGVDIYNRCMATSILTEGGKQGARVIGATAINIRTGEFYVVKAKATVVTTGYVSRLFFYAGNQWRGNWGYEGAGVTNTGDGMAMAYRAGAELVNMEASIPSRAAFGSCNQPIAGGAGLDDRRGDSLWPSIIIDCEGKPVPTMMGPYRNPHGLGIGNVPFFMSPGASDKWDGEILRDMIKDGKVIPPLYVSLSTLNDQDRKVIQEVNQGNEGGWLGQMNLGKAWNNEETEYQRPYIPRYGREPKRGTAGVFINTEAETTLEGLFAGGDQTCGSVDASGAGVWGYRAGDRAAKYAKKAADAVISSKQVENEKARVYAPVGRTEGVSWSELTLDGKYVMTTYCSDIKTEGLFKRGLRAFDEIKKQELPKLHARNPHELMRALETMNIITVGETILHSSAARKASSKALGFFRTDYPEMDPPEWRKFITIAMKDGKVKIGSRPI